MDEPSLSPREPGMNPGHGPRHDFQMRVVDTSRPITKGIPQFWMPSSEQLTHGRHGPAQGLTVLTSAYSKDSHQNEPNPNYECIGFQTLLSRGVEWAASGRVIIPIPAKFPSRGSRLTGPCI